MVRFETCKQRQKWKLREEEQEEKEEKKKEHNIFKNQRNLKKIRTNNKERKTKEKHKSRKKGNSSQVKQGQEKKKGQLTGIANLPEVDAHGVISVVNLGELVGRTGEAAFGLCVAVLGGTVRVNPPTRVIVEHGAAADEPKGRFILQTPTHAFGQNGGRGRGLEAHLEEGQGVKEWLNLLPGCLIAI